MTAPADDPIAVSVDTKYAILTKCDGCARIGHDQRVYRVSMQHGKKMIVLCPSCWQQLRVAEQEELRERCERLRQIVRQMPIDREESGLQPGDLDDTLRSSYDDQD